ncbi:MAG TPA: hypothetical protein VNN07_10010 [Candidatus Tectomicrobia bacterium]|nr:hypothetical protein [Candidatus Tectomicrobia bacterium]
MDRRHARYNRRAVMEPASSLREEPARDAERHRTLLAITNAIISNLTRQELFAAIAGALRHVVPFDRAAIFLHDPARDVLRLFVMESAWTSRYFVVGLEVPPRGSHIGWVLEHRTPLLRRDLPREREWEMEERGRMASGRTSSSPSSRGDARSACWPSPAGRWASTRRPTRPSCRRRPTRWRSPSTT